MDWRYSAVVAHKDATIERFEKALQVTEKDNERLNSQVGDLRTYRGQDSPPLKKKALILSKQIREFISTWKEGDPSALQAENVQKYLKRFGLRASILKDDLDQNGQHSDALDKAIQDFAFSYREVGVIADELDRLASRLPD